MVMEYPFRACRDLGEAEIRDITLKLEEVGAVVEQRGEIDGSLYLLLKPVVQDKIPAGDERYTGPVPTEVEIRGRDITFRWTAGMNRQYMFLADCVKNLSL